MRVVVQRSKKSSVTVNNHITGKIDNGLVLLVGFTYKDSSCDIDYMIKKILGLRIFDDEDGIMNKSILETGGQILSISQFTLYADTKKGNRPSYIKSLNAEAAKILYDEFNQKLSEHIHVETGIFQTEMQVSIENDGPITILLESDDKYVKEG